MMISDRLYGVLHHTDSTLRGVSLLLGLNLILAGLIIFLYPKVLVFIISLAFVASGLGVIIAAFRSGNRESSEDSLWEHPRL